MLCALLSPRSIHFHWRKLYKALYEKVRYVLNSLMWYWKIIDRTNLVLIVCCILYQWRVYIIIVHFYLALSCLFCCDKMTICNFYIFVYFHQWDWCKIRNLWFHVTTRTWVWTPIGQLQAVSKIYSGNFCIRRHMFHRWVYNMWLTTSVLFSDILSTFVNQYSRVLDFLVFQ